MAAIQNRHPNISAITPDPSGRPSSSTTTQLPPPTNNDALSQYSAYRSAPQLYPSYDHLRFVALPQDWVLPYNRQITDNGHSILQYWPALVYDNYLELVRDLGRGSDNRVKGKFLILHTRYNGAVARLLRWDDALRPSYSTSPSAEEGSGSNSKQADASLLFPEEKPNIVQLGSNTTLAELDSSNSTKVLSFYDAQGHIEECCTTLLQRYHGTKNEEERRVYKYAVQFQKAVDMGLNCLALDMGVDVMPDRGLKTPGVTSSTAAASLHNGKVAVAKEEEGMKSVAVESKVQNLEVALPTDTTKSTGDNVVTTKSSKAVAQKATKPSKLVTTSKNNEGATRTESKRGGGGGGGSKSRPEASQTIPKKFQSASKPSSSSSSTTTQTHPPLPWVQVWKIMRNKGWTWKGPVGLMTGYRYIKPGCKIKNGLENVDYFNSEEGAQRFARDVYGWGLRNNTPEELERAIEDHAQYAGEVVPPLPSSVSIGPNEPWRDVWDKLRQGGWTWKAGSGLMMDYYYIKPNCLIKGGVKGQDYFERVEDVQKFAKRNYGWVGEVLEGEGKVLGGLSEKKLPEKRRRKEKVTVDEPVVKKVKTLKSKGEKMKSIKEEQEMMEEEESDEEMTSSEHYDGDDDDDMSRFSEARSTYSQSGFQSKKLFVNECADENVPSLEGEQIYPDDPWSVVWKTMRKTGWTWKVGSGLMTDYYYIKPGCNVKDGEEGKDYFVSVEDVQRFAERNYGWNRSLSYCSNGSSESKTSVPAKIETKKTVKKSRNSQQKEQQNPEPLRPDPYTWKTLWPALQKDGWRVIKAGKYNQLHDWYYVRPNCDPGDGSSELHIDYFLSEEDVSQFARENGYFEGDEESNREERAEPATSEQIQHAPKRVKSSAKNPSTPQGCETKPQDPAKPLLSSAESCSSHSSSSSTDYYDWGNLWPVLQTAGWRVVKASNPLHDWYYLRPNRDPRDSNTKLGRHYFTCPDDVIEFVKSLDEKDVSGKPSRKSDIGVMLRAFEEEATVHHGSQL